MPPAGQRPSRRSGRPSSPSQRCGDRADTLTLLLEGHDGVLLLQRHRDVVQAVQQPVLDLGVDLEPELVHRLGIPVDARLAARGDLAALLGREDDWQEPVRRRVAAEEVAEAGSDDDGEAVVEQGPNRMLPARPAAEVRTGHEDRIELELETLLAPLLEQEVAITRALDTLQVLRRDDLIGVDVVPRQLGDGAFHDCYRVHAQLQWRMSTKCPSIAAAAAICGLTRWLRAPRPCRPSKLRFEVEATRSPGAATSGFIPRHIEQPASRQSKPAARKTSCSPSASACAFTCAEPGTTIAFTLDATLRPFSIDAAARRSPMRLFVHEPMKTRSSRISVIGVPGSSAMSSSARSAPPSFGSGTVSVTATTIPGVVPQVTCGLSALASTTISRSKVAPSSECSSRHAGSISTPRSSSQAKVVSSGATIPARPPPSIVMLQMVMRPSIEIDSTGAPAYSTTCPTAPPVPIGPIVPRIKSFGVTPLPSSPS